MELFFAAYAVKLSFRINLYILFFIFLLFSPLISFVFVIIISFAFCRCSQKKDIMILYSLFSAINSGQSSTPNRRNMLCRGGRCMFKSCSINLSAIFTLRSESYPEIFARNRIKASFMDIFLRSWTV